MTTVVTVLVILPLYAVLLVAFYGPVGYSRSSVEATPSGRDGRH